MGRASEGKILKLKDQVDAFNGVNFTDWFETLDGIFTEAGLRFSQRVQHMLRHANSREMQNFKSVQTYVPSDYLEAMGILMDTYWSTDSNYKRHPEDWKRKVLDCRVEANASAINAWILNFVAMDATCKRRGVVPPTIKELVRAQDPGVQEKIRHWFRASQDDLEDNATVQEVLQILRQWARDGLSNWQQIGDARHGIIGNSGDPEARQQLIAHTSPSILIAGTTTDPTYIPEGVSAHQRGEPAARAAYPLESSAPSYPVVAPARQRYEKKSTSQTQSAQNVVDVDALAERLGRMDINNLTPAEVQLLKKAHQVFQSFQVRTRQQPAQVLLNSSDRRRVFPADIYTMETGPQFNQYSPADSSLYETEAGHADRQLSWEEAEWVQLGYPLEELNEVSSYSKRPFRTENCWYCQSPGHILAKCMTLQGDRDTGVCSHLSGKTDMWYMGRERSDRSSQPSLLRVPTSWIRDNRGSYSLRLIIFAYIRAIYQWCCPTFEPYKAMVARLGGENSAEFAKTMAKSPGDVDFRKYIAGCHDKNTLARWGFSIDHLRASLRSAYPGEIDEEKTVWEILNVEIPGTKRIRIEGKTPTPEEELIYQMKNRKLKQARAVNRDNPAPEETKSALPGNSEQDQSSIEASATTKRTGSTRKVTFDDDPKGEAAANSSLSNPSIRLNQLQYARNNPTWGLLAGKNLISVSRETMDLNYEGDEVPSGIETTKEKVISGEHEQANVVENWKHGDSSTFCYAESNDLVCVVWSPEQENEVRDQLSQLNLSNSNDGTSDVENQDSAVPTTPSVPTRGSTNNESPSGNSSPALAPDEDICTVFGLHPDSDDDEEDEDWALPGSRFNTSVTPNVPRHPSPFVTCRPSRTPEDTKATTIVLVDPDLEPGHIGLAEGADTDDPSTVSMRSPELPTVKITVGEKHGKSIRALIDTGASCNILAESYVISQGLNMESTERTFATYNAPQPVQFRGRVVDRIWLGGRFIFQEFFIADANPGVRPCLLGMPFVAATDPAFRYKDDGSLECTMAFGSIDIRAQVCRSFADREKAYTAAVLDPEEALKAKLS